MAKQPAELASIQINADVNDRLDDFCERQIRIKRQTVSRVLSWFLGQPPKIQRVVLGIDDAMDLAYADALEALAAQLRKRAKHHSKDDDPFPVNPRPA